MLRLFVYTSLLALTGLMLGGALFGVVGAAGGALGGSLVGIAVAIVINETGSLDGPFLSPDYDYFEPFWWTIDHYLLFFLPTSLSNRVHDYVKSLSKRLF